ncbi:sensor histidine kinase [Magnetospirillum fulvum]|uniref:histidine kinase n=1 Tax=Magnetospirillum fulvum TaxID=1082 RepID=A0A1H6HIN7_MAGFU|nr:PocR ligand-binding domain-containing protein [Magnetospirillum fulvum]SEH34972.1 PAS domain S-box-containing protein [Magnetospirillum fulvum]
MNLRDLLPLDDLRRLCEDFTALTGAVTAVLDLEGNILIATGWQDICTRFHRVNSETAIRCRESDTILAARLHSGESYTVYKCGNGLVDVAVPIVVMGEHIGNFFTGQFFFEAPDIGYFQDQARAFGFPSDAYLDALSRVPIFSEAQVRAMMGFFTNLTHLICQMGLTKARQEITNRDLRESRHLLQTIIDSVPIRVFWKDTDLRYLGCNPQFAQDAGFAMPEEIIGRDDFQLVWADRAELYREDDRVVMESGIPKLFFDEQIRTRDGGVIWCRTSKIPLRDETGETIGVLGIFEDITQHKLAEQMLMEKNTELQRSNSDLEQFAYVSSHDLQTPLRNVIHFSQLLKRRYDGRLDADADEFIRFIIDSGTQMSRLISDILEYSRVASQPRVLGPIPAGEAVAKALQNLGTEIAAAGADVRVAALPDVIAEFSLLVSLFQNLIGNAVKYRDPARPLVVSVGAEAAEPGHVRISVADTGIGIDPAYHEKIFEIFQRLVPASALDGTGIGLALCRRIVHRLGGTIGLDSVVGVGTTFNVTLRTEP